MRRTLATIDTTKLVRLAEGNAVTIRMPNGDELEIRLDKGAQDSVSALRTLGDLTREMRDRLKRGRV